MAGKIRVWGQLVGFGILLAGCSGSDNPDRGGNGADSPGASGSSGTSDASCVERALFPAEAHGHDGADLIRAIQVDQDGKKLIFSDLNDLFEVPLAGGEPSLLGARPNDGAEFWLEGEQLLFPAGIATPVIEEQQAVLFSADRALSKSEVAVGIPAPQSLEWEYQVGDVVIVGDDVYWIAVDKHTDDPFDTLPTYDTTYAVRRTSWSKPAEPEELYSTKLELETLVVAGDYAFVRQIIDPENSTREHRVIDLKTKTVLDESSEDKFGGDVVAGSETSLLVSKLQLDPPYESGVFRISPDGSGQVELTSNPFVSDFVRSGDTWLYVDPKTLSDPRVVLSYREGDDAPKTLGCIDSSASVHAITSSDSKVYVGVYRDKKTTILQFDR